MAAMYTLFCGVLFTAVCSIVGIGDRTVNRTVFPPTDRRASVALGKMNHEKSIRYKIIRMAEDQLGVQEATDNNDGERIEEYLAYTGLGKGHAWCAAFVSWCYGQAGLSAPRNPWSPALFPNSKTYCRGDACRHLETIARIKPADIFGIYSSGAGRINHVGLIKAQEGRYLVTIEGNVADKVLSKRRHISTIYAVANWAH